MQTQIPSNYMYMHVCMHVCLWKTALCYKILLISQNHLYDAYSLKEILLIVSFFPQKIGTSEIQRLVIAGNVLKEYE